MRILFRFTLWMLVVSGSFCFVSGAHASRTMCGEVYENDEEYLDNDYHKIVDKPEFNATFWQQAKNDFYFRNWEENDFKDESRTGSRIMAALWVLKNAGDGSTPILDAAYNYVAHRVDKLQATCSASWLSSAGVCGGESIACFKGLYGDVLVSRQSLYQHHVLSIAATLYHEARHSDQDVEDVLKGDTHPGWPHGPMAPWPKCV